MFQIHTEEMMWGGRSLRLETGKIARQADGSVMVTYGQSQILCTVVGAKEQQEGADFFPLSVHYLEKMYAAGKIPGGYIKRETKPSDSEVLTSRLIDRPIRPLFPEGFYNEVQVVCTVVSSDGESDLAVASIIGASAALSISGIPFLGPIAAARVAYKNGNYVLNPINSDLASSSLDLIVAGTDSGVLMVESEAKELSEEIMLGAVEFGHKEFQPIISMINRLKERVNKPIWEVKTQSDEKSALKEKAKKIIGDDFRSAYALKSKQDRVQALKTAKEKCIAEMTANDADLNLHLLDQAIKSLGADILRQDILIKKSRIDGRGLKDIRPILAETGILTRTHGSALFTRGETQALVAITLGTAQDEQVAESLYG
ncbi:MAG: polyribonucleotide nucleotidyltransferase, partial [Proteobacteria bacterium]|nr:polyribonucleotide nucleotidyltransferase [Pseudomonadota bacterium]